MPPVIIYLILFVIQLIALFFLSRITINNLFHFFRLFSKNDKAVFGLVSLIFFPGTILHEFAHFFAAIILFMRVRDIKIFPEWEGDYIKLGRVLYEKKDFVRGVLVGIAPIIAGLLFFLAISAWRLFPNQNIWINVLIVYIIFTVSSMMFSSKQDLIDLVFVLPLFIVLAGIIYIFDIKFDFIFRDQTVSSLFASFLNNINFYLFLSLAIHIGIIATLKIFSQLWTRSSPKL